MAALAMRGLAVPIGLHAAWNFGQWTLGEKETPGLCRPVVEHGYVLYVDHMGMLGYLLVFGSATVAFYLFGNFQTHREQKQAAATAQVNEQKLGASRAFAQAYYGWLKAKAGIEDPEAAEDDEMDARLKEESDAERRLMTTPVNCFAGWACPSVARPALMPKTQPPSRKRKRKLSPPD